MPFRLGAPAFDRLSNAHSGDGYIDSFGALCRAKTRRMSREPASRRGGARLCCGDVGTDDDVGGVLVTVAVGDGDSAAVHLDCCNRTVEMDRVTGQSAGKVVDEATSRDGYDRESGAVAHHRHVYCRHASAVGGTELQPVDPRLKASGQPVPCQNSQHRP